MNIESFYLVETIFSNMSRKINVGKYTDTESATDLKQMKESYFDLCHEYIHYGSENVEND